jgi:hypothetical protein
MRVRGDGPRRTSRTRVAKALAVLALLIAAALATSGPAGSAPGLQLAIQVQEGNSGRLLERGNVVGTGVGRDDGGAAEIVVLARRQIRVPESLAGIPVELKVTGPIGSLGLGARPDKKPDSPGNGKGNGGGGGGETEASPSPTDRFSRPTPIGVSTGNAGECSAGTIGARVTDGAGNFFALSNNHVYALENEAPLGSMILQPGRYDTGCAFDEADAIGVLAAFEPISFTQDNEIDAAIASLDEAGGEPVVGNSTPPDGYGTPSSETAVGIGAVKKYGRTTAETHGYAYAINGIVKVGYGGGTARFVNQVFVEGQRGPFLKAGDSGSLLVSDDAAANPVGLLFAGDNSGKFAVANQIDAVLERFGVAIDGK